MRAVAILQTLASALAALAVVAGVLILCIAV